MGDFNFWPPPATAAREVGVTAYAMAQDLLRPVLRVAMPLTPPPDPPEAVAGLVSPPAGFRPSSVPTPRLTRRVGRLCAPWRRRVAADSK